MIVYFLVMICKRCIAERLELSNSLVIKKSRVVFSGTQTCSLSTNPFYT